MAQTESKSCNKFNPIRSGLLGGIKPWGRGRITKNHTFENPLLIVKML